MKTGSQSLLAGVGAPLFLAGVADAGFVGLVTVSKPAPPGPMFPGGQVINVFARFNNPTPGQDLFLSAAGTPNSPMDIHVISGTFFQHPFEDANDKAPNAALVAFFPSLAFDTFVTIGVKKVGTAPGVPPGSQSPDNLVLTPGWPGFGTSSLAGNSLAWAVTPADGQSNPFNPNYANGNGDVLIGQFTTTDGVAIVGMFRILVRSNGVNTQINVTFFGPTPAALPLLAVAGLVGTKRRRRRPAEG